MTTFHVVYTAGTTTALLPLALSLLESPAARFVLVDNSCAPEESERIRSVADAEPRFSYYRLPFDRVVRHGVALDHLLPRCHESTFAILDSDILATGDFLAELLDRPPACGAICSGWPVWIEDDEAVITGSQPFLGGPYRALTDGTAVGGTGCAIYDRAALQIALDKIEVGFSNRTSGTLGNELRRSFTKHGWNFARFGTARVAHLQLALQGNPVVNRECTRLHHIGGLSHKADVASSDLAQKIRRTISLLLRGTRSPATNFMTNVRRRLGRDGKEQARIYARKKKVVVQTAALMEALRRSNSTPQAVPTGSVEVDSRFNALFEALVRDYPALCDRVSLLARTGSST